jgi:hypothetical protein
VNVPSVDFLLLMLQFYLLTVLVETAVLLVGLSPRHPLWVKLFAGVWLTACTYPVVWLVLPGWFEDRARYLIVAETFAPLAECLLFRFAFLRGQPLDRRFLRDMLAIIAANLASFGVGEWIHAAS